MIADGCVSGHFGFGGNEWAVNVAHEVFQLSLDPFAAVSLVALKVTIGFFQGEGSALISNSL